MSTSFAGLGFCATFTNADPSVIGPLGVVNSLAPQVASGLNPGLSSDKLGGWIDRCHEANIDVFPWAWCAATTVDEAKAEAAYHVERCAAINLTDAFVANPEETYDAHGDSTSARYKMVAAYVEAFENRAAELGIKFGSLGMTSTPFFGSDMTVPIQHGWTGMPQAFSLANPAATIAACVKHWNAWGWPTDQLRPLVQVYETLGQRPEAQPFLDESEDANVGVIPYVVEQAMDQSGRALLDALKPATFRGVTDGGGMEQIGFQNGVQAFCNRQRDIDPGGTLLKKITNEKGRLEWQPLEALADVPLGKWRAIDKLERTLRMLVLDHDARAAA